MRSGSNQEGQALTEYALVAAALVAACWVAAGPLGFYQALRSSFDSTSFVLSLPFP